MTHRLNEWGWETLAGQTTTYLSALHELHDEEEVLVVFVDVKELDDVGVVDLLQDVDFVLKTNFVFLGKFAPKLTKNLVVENVHQKKEMGQDKKESLQRDRIR